MTPNIDRLAATGTRFQHCYVTPLCSTTRVQLLTGRYGYSTGWHTHHDAATYGGGGLDPKRETTFARALRDAGYATTIAGKWQINDLYDQRDVLKQHGFDEHLVWTGALAGEGLAEARWQASIAPGGKREHQQAVRVAALNAQRTKRSVLPLRDLWRYRKIVQRIRNDLAASPNDEAIQRRLAVHGRKVENFDADAAKYEALEDQIYQASQPQPLRFKITFAAAADKPAQTKSKGK